MLGASFVSQYSEEVNMCYELWISTVHLLYVLTLTIDSAYNKVVWTDILR